MQSKSADVTLLRGAERPYSESSGIIKILFGTAASYAPAILRVMLGLVLFPHGAQKLLGSFGGYGFTGTMGFLTETVGLPWLIAVAVIMIEFFGAILLIAGLATRINAALVIVLFIGIIFSSHIDNGFFMNWFGNQQGEGFEYHLLVIGMAISLVFSGGGNLSVDKRISS